MIISNKYKFIFFPIPRTASHCIRNAIRPFLVESDWEQKGLYGSNKRLPFNVGYEHGHISVKEIGKYLNLDDYFKFTIVRNPYDRLISAFSFQRRLIDFNSIPTNHPFMYRPQMDFIENKMDYIGKFENIQHDFDKICKIIGFPRMPLGKVNSSIRKQDWKSYYNKESYEKVESLYLKDFKKLGYELCSQSA